jgi:hypothetical protein
MNSNIYTVDFHRLAALLLPLPLRQERIIALCGVLAKTFTTLLAILTKYRDETMQRLRYNGQTCRLEYCLNFRFGSTDTIDDISSPDRIRILDGTQTDGKPYIIYQRDVNAIYPKPKHRGETGQIILNRRSVNNQSFYNFVVQCPRQYLTTDGSRDEKKEDPQKIKQLTSVVNTYKTQGKTWELRIV